ncbi:MAG: response regulator [Myxococcales bacterium]|nr:response regulator [Myxococcales bacterium]
MTRSTPARAATATVLVAEDEPAVRELMVEVLREAGHEVLAAADGDAALELARRSRRPIDVLCTDGVMPGLPSSELVAQFAQLYPRAPILVCSGHLPERQLDARIHDRELLYLGKPFTGTQLVAAVARALDA